MNKTKFTVIDLCFLTSYNSSPPARSGSLYLSPRRLAHSLAPSLNHSLTDSLTHSCLLSASFLLPPSSFLLPSPLPVYIFASSSPIWARLDPNLIASSRCSWARLDPNTRQIECQTECQNRCQIDCPIECQTRCQLECQNDVVVLICFNKLLSFPHFKNG